MKPVSGLGYWLLAGCLLTGMPVLAGEPVQPLAIYGWIETIRLQPENIELEAKLDTGADTSSLDARNIQYFSRDGQDWVHFRISGADGELFSGREFERPVERRILVHGAGGSEHRVVVRMQLCIGTQMYEEPFSLRDRSDMNYPVLIGRRTLQHLGLVDVRLMHVQPPLCSSPP
jgi:hypothetical protein